MNLALRLFSAFALASLVAAPSFADGKKGKPAFVAPPVAPLRIPQQPAVLPPLPPTIVPFDTAKVDRTVTLPASFGTGGVGIDINGGYGGGGRTVIIAGGGGRAAAAAFAFASASATAIAGARSRGGFKGGGHGCGGCK